MNIDEFIEGFHPAVSEHCPLVIDGEGEVYECKKSHLDTLIMLSGDPQLLCKLPEDVSPLFYLLTKQRCIAVDYENQVYSGELSKRQKEVLGKLYAAGLIRKNEVDIHSKFQI